MCIGRLKNGIVEEPVWKSDIKINNESYLVKISRPRRNIKTGKSVYSAQTEYKGEIISIDDEAYDIDEAISFLRNKLETIVS
jgi:hypothetical protein